MSEADDEIREHVQANRELIADTLVNSHDPYVRACALVLLKHGGDTRDLEVVREEIENRC